MFTYLDRMYKFIGQNYGGVYSNKFNQYTINARDGEGNLTAKGRAKVYEYILIILQREIAKSYQIARNAFTTFDPLGRNYITSDDILNSKFIFKLPFNKQVSR